MQEEIVTRFFVKEFIDNTWIELEVCSLAQVASERFYWFWWSMKVTFYKFLASHCGVLKGMKNLGVDTKQKISRNFMQLSIVKVVEEYCLSSRVQGCQEALEFFSHYDAIFSVFFKDDTRNFYGAIVSYLCSLHAYSGDSGASYDYVQRRSTEGAFLMN